MAARTYDLLWREAMVELVDALEVEDPEQSSSTPQARTEPFAVGGRDAHQATTRPLSPGPATRHTLEVGARGPVAVQPLSILLPGVVPDAPP